MGVSALARRAAPASRARTVALELGQCGTRRATEPCARRPDRLRAGAAPPRFRTSAPRPAEWPAQPATSPDNAQRPVSTGTTLWWGSEWSDRQVCWSRPSVVSRGVPLPSFAKGLSSGPKSWCPASGSGEPRARLCDLDAGDEGAERASSSETCIFVECIQSTKAQLCDRLGEVAQLCTGL